MIKSGCISFSLALIDPSQVHEGLNELEILYKWLNHYDKFNLLIYEIKVEDSPQILNYSYLWQ